MIFKYVRFGCYGIVTWPDTDLVSHVEAAAPFRAWFEPVSAGFARVTKDEVICYGESVSLDLKSKPEDSDILRTQLGR